MCIHMRITWQAADKWGEWKVETFPLWGRQTDRQTDTDVITMRSLSAADGKVNGSI